MSDQASMYLLNAKKLLNTQRPQKYILTELQPQQQSVDSMFKYIHQFKQSKLKQQQSSSLLPSSQQLSPTKLFAQQKSKRLGHLYSNHPSLHLYQSRSYQNQLIQQSQSYLQQQRQRNKLHSIQNQKIISSIRNFDEAKNPTLPLDDINRQCQMFPNYLQFVQPVRRETTKPSFDLTEKDLVPKLVIEEYGKKEDKVKYQDVVEIELEEQTEESNQKEKDRKIKGKVQNIIRKNPMFLKLMGTYIMYFVKEQLRQDLQVNILDQQSVKKYQIITNPPQLRQQTLVLNQSLQKPITPLQLRYQINEGQKPIYLAPKLFQKVANKRNGDSLKFHPKTFIMNGQQLVYHGEDSNMKMLIVKPQVLELKTVEKQVGGFFNRQKVDTQSFIIKSQQRTLEIEYHQLQGSEIFKCMVDYFALKVYQCFCIETETVQSKFKRFLMSDKYTKWDFEDMNCGDEQVIEYALPYFFMVLELRDTLKSISFKNNHLQFYTVQYILLRITEINPTGLSSLTISGNQIQNNGVKLYCSLFLRLKTLSEFSLSSCNLNTIHIEQIALTFSQNSLDDRDITLLDLSYNPDARLRQTSNNIMTILNIFRPKTLLINQCKITNDDFIDLLNFRFNFVEIQCNQCGLVFDDEMIRRVIREMERNYLLKVIIANGNQVLAGNQVLVGWLERPQLREIAIDFPPEFFTDVKNSKNQWVIVPL